MGLRCLIGHEYGEPQTSRDRTQRGNEVVTTVREYRECARCGHRRIISENKEITTEATGGSSEMPAAEASWSGEPESEDQPSADAFARSSSASAGAPDEPMTAAEDDGVILEDEPETTHRAHGQWPEADFGEEPAADASDDPDPWPDEEVSSPTPEEPEPPEPPGPDDDPLDVGPEPTSEPATDDESEGSEVLTDDADTMTGGVEPSPSPRPDNRNTEFVCPDCGETWPSQNASLRPGDICPECRRGYLDERVVQ